MLQLLEEFKTQVNDNAHIQRIVKGWNTDVLLEESDSKSRYRLAIEDGKIQEVQVCEPNTSFDCTMRIIGDSVIMQGLFAGRVNGIRANNEGLLSIYGPMNDQVKLDAIALILWGL